MSNPVYINEVATHFPAKTLISTIQSRIACTGEYQIQPDLISRITGVKEKPMALDHNVHPSNLATQAARKLFAQTELSTTDIESLIFGSASLDVIEPATACIVAQLLGLAVGVPVVDMKNACNSFIESITRARDHITVGRYKNVLVCSGEIPSRVTNMSIANEADFIGSLPGYIFGDGGAALIVSDQPVGLKIIDDFSYSDCRNWNTGIMPGSGSRASDYENSFVFQAE